MEKKGVVAFSFLLLLILLQSVSALGLSPAGTDINFQPGFEQTIKYVVSGASSTKDIEISASGALAQYVTFDKKVLRGGGEFLATIKLPQTLEKPGRLITYIGAKEKLDEELAQMIGTAVGVNAAILVYVPYPGRYLEMEFSGGDANVGEPITFHLNMKNSGKEDLVITPEISIVDSLGVEKERLILVSRKILSQEKLELKKTLDTLGYNPGNYKAVASVDYGILAKAETPFKIGSLSIDISNYTNLFYVGKRLQKFDVGIKSGWNNNIDGVSAEIVLLNVSKEITRFQTSATSLTPWEEKTITGYFDSSEFTQGTYDANITISYYGKEQGKSTTKTLKISFIKRESNLVWWIVGGAGLLILIVLILNKILKRNGKRKKK